ncbi:NnrS family protein [Candidatus Marinarcus aquaticus]|uniref:Beta-carotene 15,15'-monooxygenase n=1 Tax=Candidatus Marinarcus aquaticus TaxID=2044504 RepID=A0A4Q0XT68_9BACT|nr:NnrS family protein [Candidatus Marinarcus aquaticus]RXJ60532.1 beta-carotene 15,15'-monooxygenase [Candidatus Marinarcus aquaticus]
MFKNWYQKFSAQPHQPFFTSGIILFILFLGLLFGVYNGTVTVTSDVLTFHAYAFIFVIFSQFFLGFLFVVFPRFLMQANIAPKRYMTQFIFYGLGSILFFVGLLLSKPLYLVGMFVLILTQTASFIVLYRTYKNSLMKEKYDAKWVLVGYVSGLISHAVFILSQFSFEYATKIEHLTIVSGFYLYLFVVVFTISQRMVPFFTSMKVVGYSINKSKYLMEKVYGLLVFKVLLITLDQPSLYLLADFPLLILFVYELYRWKLPLFKVSAIMWVLFISLYWIPVGFLIACVQDVAYLMNSTFVFEQASLHAFAVGYFVTVLIGFGTRVVLGHSGQTPHADRWAVAMFIFIQAVVLVRLWASISINFEADYIFWINHSALLLIIGLLAWSVKYLRILIKGHTPEH